MGRSSTATCSISTRPCVEPAFAVQGDQVLLVSERSTLDLDRSEVRELIKRVTTYADDHDDVLVARFGGTMGSATGLDIATARTSSSAIEVSTFGHIVSSPVSRRMRPRKSISFAS